MAAWNLGVRDLGCGSASGSDNAAAVHIADDAPDHREVHVAD